MRRFSMVTALLMLMAAPSGAAGQAVGDKNPQLRRFVVTLALGDMQPGTSGTFSPAEMKALADVKDFLPYKTYRPLDAAFIIGLGGPPVEMTGIAGRKHSFYMRASVLSPTTTSVEKLTLVEVPSGTRGLTTLIDTAFRIELGETVVVGTSRLDSVQALLLLVTSVR